MEPVRTTRVFTKFGDDTLAYLLVEPLNGEAPKIGIEGVKRYEGHVVNGYDVSGGRSVADTAYVLAMNPMRFDEAFSALKELSDLVKDA